jgi:c-di-GMP-binding flagellar brake protein YcgR
VPQTNAQINRTSRRGWRDLRATIRYRCAPATYGRVFLNEEEEDHEYQRAWLADLSLSGVGLVMVRSIPVGHSIYILIRTPTTQQLLLLQGRVVHATQQVSGEWLIGCQFDRPLTREELDELLS